MSEGRVDTETIHAARGTAAHTIAEKAMQDSRECEFYLGTEVKTKGFTIEIDQELVDSAQVYVDYVMGKVLGDTTLLLEQKFSLAALDPPFDAGGTCDAVLVQPSRREIEVVDLKNGMGLVEIKENKQTRTYALAALLNLPDHVTKDIDRIKVTIVQPRAPHSDGRIRSEEFHVADLIEWSGDLLKAMYRARDAHVAFFAPQPDPDWAEKYLRPGNCAFCPAMASCPALRHDALSIAGDNAVKWFEDETAETAVALPNPMDLTPTQLAHCLDGFSMLEDWIDAIRNRAHRLAEDGLQLPGYMLVDKIGNRTWIADETQTVSDLKSIEGLIDDSIFRKKLATPAQIEKILGAKKKGLIEKLFYSPKRGTNLVSTSKSTRQPAQIARVANFEKPET